MAKTRSEVKTVTLYNQQNEDGTWAGLNVSIGSWITMQPKLRGEHGITRSRLNDVRAHWKARVKQIIFNPSGKTVKELVVEHAYDSQDMRKEPISTKPWFPFLEANSICSSDFTDAVSPESITSILHVHHFQIGHLLFKNCTMARLRDRNIWFHRFHYVITPKGAGKLLDLDPPSLQSMGSEFSDCKQLTSYQEYMAREVYRTLTERGGVRCAIKAFLPINVFSYIFQSESSMKIAPQTYTFVKVCDETLKNVFGQEWRRREHETGGQITECVVASDTIIFRYRLTKQTLYANYFIERKRRVRENNNWTWKAVEEHVTRSPSMDLEVHCAYAEKRIINVEEEWSLLECREILNTFRLYGDFQFYLNGKKIGYRREYSIKCKDCKIPKQLEIIKV